MLSVGLDIESTVEVSKKSFLTRSQAFFTKDELLYCNNKVDSFTGLICLKESVIKALSSLVVKVPRYTYKDIELCHGLSGEPYVKTYNDLDKFMSIRKLKIEVSITHTSDIASSIALIYK